MAHHEQVDILSFELPRRVVLLSSTTTMPDGSSLGVTGDPNVLDAGRVVDTATGEFLLANSPPMTLYLDTVGDVVWRRTTVNTWVTLGGGGGSLNDPIYIGGKGQLDSWVLIRDIDDNFTTEGISGGINDSKLHFLRYESGAYITKAQFGDSIHTDKYFIHKESGGYTIPNGIGGDHLVSRKSNRGTHGIISGGYAGRLALISNAKDTLLHGYPVGELLKGGVFDKEAAMDYLTTDYLEWVQPVPDFLSITYYFAMWIDKADVFWRATFHYEDNGDLLHETSTDYEFLKGLANKTVVGKNSLIMTDPLAVDANRKLVVRIYTSEPIGFRKTVGSPLLHVENSYQKIEVGRVPTLAIDSVDSADTNSDWSEREADRAFTLHDLTGGGLASQDGKYLSFNHIDSPAFQEETSTDYLWANYHKDEETGGQLSTLHIHGNDSMISMMNGDCLDFSPSVEILSGTTEGSWSITWNYPEGGNIIGSKVPNLIINVPEFQMNQRCYYYLEVSTRRDNITLLTYDSKSGDRNSEGSLTHTFTPIHLLPFDGSVSSTQIDDQILDWKLVFYNKSSVAHEVVGQVYVASPTEVVEEINMSRSNESTTYWESLSDLDLWGRKKLPRVVVTIPMVTTDVPTKINITVTKTNGPDSLMFNYSGAEFLTDHTLHSGALYVPHMQAALKYEDLDPYSIKIQIVVTSRTGQTEVFNSLTLVNTNDIPSQPIHHARSRVDGSSNGVGRTRYEVWYDGQHLTDDVKATIWIDSDFGGNEGYFVDDVDIYVMNEDVRSFSIYFAQYARPITSSTISHNGDDPNYFDVRCFGADGNWDDTALSLGGLSSSGLLYHKNKVMNDGQKFNVTKVLN